MITRAGSPGTGLLALDARRRAGPDGHVIALDISKPALQFAEVDAAERRGELAPLSLAMGEATAIPLADHSTNVITTRSVLIYVLDKEAAAQEMFRVLRPGGRVSMFEPINSADEDYGRPNGPGDLPEKLNEERHQIREHIDSVWQEHDPDAKEAMVGFDERKLVNAFIDAGFERVALRYEMGFGRSPTAPNASAAAFENQANPNVPSYAEAARAVLGRRARAHLDEMTEHVRTRGGSGLGGVALLTAKRSRRRRPS